MTPPDSDSDSARDPLPSELRRVPKGSRLERRLEELRSALEKLETEIGRELHNASQGGGRAHRKSAPPVSSNSALERELKRVRQELAQRKVEITELRTEAARALQRAEQENERLRDELATSQRLVEAAIGVRRQSGFLNDRGSEPPANSGVEGRRTAETLRPGARKGR